ncbi:hypothetical protein B0H14DRAFT_2639939 [Mycena olivaceomarginata]|nr:hypothetical protein B0H14DRAFT_2639939 [Mycena olivaceomarginata]
MADLIFPGCPLSTVFLLEENPLAWLWSTRCPSTLRWETSDYLHILALSSYPGKISGFSFITSVSLAFPATDPVFQQHNVSHNLQYFQQTSFPCDHLRFTHGLRLLIELVDPKHQDQALAGITWPAKAFKTKQMPEDWTVEEGKRFVCPLSPDSIVLASDEEPTEPTPLPAAKGRGKGKTGAKKTNKQSLSPSAEQGTSKKPRKPDSKVIVTNEVVSEDEPAKKLTAEQKSALNKKKKDMAAGRLLRRPETVPVVTEISQDKSVAEAQYAAMYPHYRKQKRDLAHTSRAALATMTEIIPNHKQQALPVDESGRFYALPFDVISTAVGLSVPTDGPRCTACQLAGSVCITRGRGQPCERCNNSHTTSACEFTFSDEVLNDLAPERALWFDMSSSGWLRAAEDLEVANENYALAQRVRDSAEKGMRYKALLLLHRIVCARAEMEHNTFVARFAGDTVEERIVRMEYYLRLAMVQGITAQSRLHRRWEWNLFHPDLLLATIPGFINAYNFYDAFDQERASNPKFNKLGYFLVPKPGEKRAAEWIEIQPSDLATITLSDGTTLHCGFSGSHARNRFMHEVFEREKITLPQAYKDLDFIQYPSPKAEDVNLGFISDLKSFFTPSTVEPPLSDSLIPIEKGETPAPVGEDFLDLEAVESSGSGSDSEESDVDMPEVQPQGNVDSSSDSSSEESESGEDAGEGEALEYESEAESDEA